MPRFLLRYLKRKNQKPSFPLQANLERNAQHDGCGATPFWDLMKQTPMDAFLQLGEQREQTFTKTQTTSRSQRVRQVGGVAGEGCAN